MVSKWQILTVLGVLQPNKKQDITLSFKTEEAKVLVTLFVIKLIDITNG